MAHFQASSITTHNEENLRHKSSHSPPCQGAGRPHTPASGSMKLPVPHLTALCVLAALAVPCAATETAIPIEPGMPPLTPPAARAGSPFIQPDPPPPRAIPVVPEETLPAITEIPHVEYTPTVYHAVMAQDDALLHTLLEAGVSADGSASDGDTPLCAALRLGRVDTALLLVLHGADPNAPGLEGHPPIALASIRRHPQLLRILLAAGADPNKPFAHPHSKALLALVPDEYLRDEMKHQRNLTPLMVCSARGDVEAVTLLLQWGADKQKHTLPNYRYAINFAADQRYLYVMRLLLGRDPEREPHILITVDLSRQKATLAVEGETKLETSISTGRSGYATPTGRYVITNKYKHWVSTLYDVPMPYFMRLNCGAIGLHSGYVTGRPASHGCIRLPHEMSKKFFAMTNVGDEVIVQY